MNTYNLVTHMNSLNLHKKIALSYITHFFWRPQNYQACCATFVSRLQLREMESADNAYDVNYTVKQK